MNSIHSLTHHATLFVHRDRKLFADTLWGELKEESRANIFHDHTVLDIETARSLIRWANTPYSGTKVALLSFHTITLPAQNALLKVIEEPSPHVQFIFVTSNKESLIETFYSRVQEQRVPDIEIQKHIEAELFLTTPSTKRMKLPYVVNILEKVDEEKRKDREGGRAFILSLAGVLQKKQVDPKYTKETLEYASYASDPSSSGKALLEYLALLLPQVH